jgi:ubiquinone/menaquinone biosynthesis C-methylase UbiE
MALPRTLEPEVMDTAQEASDYDAMDHAEVNARFCNDLLALRRPGRVLDVGTGTALIPIELCRRAHDVEAHAIDLASSMLAIARRNVGRAELGARIHIESGDAKSMRWEDGAFDTVISNSVIHHMPDPGHVLREMRRLVGPGCMLFVRDLVRPESAERVRQLVETYAPLQDCADAVVQAMQVRQRALFEASLHAALTLDEVVALAAPLGIPSEAVRLTSDRHWTLSGRALPLWGVHEGT